MVRIIVDSTADLRPETRQRVGVVPLTIHFGKEEYVDGVTITGAEFYKKLAVCKDLPTTSQAAPYVFAEAFEEAVEAGDTVVCIVVSSALSGTCQSANIAAADYPGKVYVVDSRSIAIGTSILRKLRQKRCPCAFSYIYQLLSFPNDEIGRFFFQLLVDLLKVCSILQFLRLVVCHLVYFPIDFPCKPAQKLDRIRKITVSFPFHSVCLLNRPHLNVLHTEQNQCCKKNRHKYNNAE